MPIPADFAAFDIDGAALTVWAFKKSGGARGAAPTFAGRWVATDPALEAAVKVAVLQRRAAIEEVNPYGLLAQNNEASALSIGADETYADQMIAATADPLLQRRATTLRHLQNTDFYVIKLVSNDAALYAVRKTDASWHTKKRRAVIDALFQDETLALEPAPAFSLSAFVDFFIFDGMIYMLDKGRFESVLSYRQAHANQFLTLQAEPAFSLIFSDMAPLVAFIGANKIQLRRACAIETKGHYRNNAFMQRLRQRFQQFHLNIVFDANGLIVPTPETCADIMTALLDHRLSSAFSEAIYDVPDAVAVV
jgi:hypothetical protein